MIHRGMVQSTQYSFLRVLPLMFGHLFAYYVGPTIMLLLQKQTPSLAEKTKLSFYIVHTSR